MRRSGVSSSSWGPYREPLRVLAARCPRGKIARMSHLLRRLAVLGLVAACAPDGIPEPPSGLPYSAATPACGPADGPAVAIYLSPNPVTSLEPATPFVHVAVWQPLDRLEDQSWTLGAGAGTASYFSTPNELESATAGSVTVSAVDPDSTVRGSVELTFPTHGKIAGGFQAHWIPVALRCG